MHTPIIRILIADRSSALRKTLWTALDHIDGIRVVAESGDEKGVLDGALQHKPDVIILDVDLALNNRGREVIGKIRQILPQTQFLILGSDSCKRELMSALAVGVHGYASKSANASQLLMALASIHAGAIWIESDSAPIVLRELAGARASGRPRAGASPDSDICLSGLSPREKEVLNLLVDGLSNKEIARQLQIGLETTKTHLRNIMRKLGVNDRTQAALKALRGGLVSW